MNLRRYDLASERTVTDELVIAMGDWVGGLCRWDCVAHLTFAWEGSIWSCERVYKRFMQRVLPQVSHFYALEQNPSREGFHVHALWVDLRVRRRSAWAAWFQRYGRARIEPVRGQGDVSDYVAKYVCKGSAWWGLFWSHNRRAHDHCDRAPLVLNGVAICGANEGVDVPIPSHHVAKRFG